MGYDLLKNKTAVITGARRGIGFATVEKFASEGADVIACLRQEDPEFDTATKELEEKYQVTIEKTYFDLSDVSEVKKAGKALVKSKKPVDILVNNAGISINALFLMSSTDVLTNQYEINFLGPIAFTQYITKIMIKHGGGRIVNIASTAGMDGTKGRTGYGSSKAALISATRIIAQELAEKNIRVNAVAPGITETDMIGDMTEEVIQETLNGTCLKRIGKPQDIANTSLFLASDLSSYITGQVLRVDGGML